jgi:3-keto-5-aminohexanoate cleavage enzyme
MKRKLIITAALTGGYHTRKEHPDLPVQPEEIARAAEDCVKAGAAIIHLHARDRQGVMSDDPEIYHEIHRRIREKCDTILQDTTGGGPNLTLDQRIRSLEANPDMATLNLGILASLSGPNPGRIFSNPRHEIERYAKEMMARDIKPEMVVCNHSCFREVENLIQKGLVKKPYFLSLSVGGANQGATPGSPQWLLSLLPFVPSDSVISVISHGDEQAPLMTLGMIMGGHVRVGLEDSLYYHPGELARDSAQFVKRCVQMAKELGMEIATPKEAREMLGIQEKSIFQRVPVKERV